MSCPVTPGENHANPIYSKVDYEGEDGFIPFVANEYKAIYYHYPQAGEINAFLFGHCVEKDTELLKANPAKFTLQVATMGGLIFDPTA